jgi:hypothetical protein
MEIQSQLKDIKIETDIDELLKIEEIELFKHEINIFIEEIFSKGLKNIKIPVICNYVVINMKYIEKLEKSITSVNGIKNNDLKLESLRQSKEYIYNFLLSYIYHKDKAIDNNSRHLKKKQQRGDDKCDNNKIMTLYSLEEPNCIYNLKIFYLDSPRNSAQIVKIIISDDQNTASFIRSLRTKLGIYEFAKFKIVILENKEGIFWFKINNNFLDKCFFESLSQLDENKLNEIKVVPISYKILNK